MTDGFGSIGKISFTFSGLERLLTAFEHERMNFLVWPHCNPRNSFGALSESGEETLDEVTETLENKVKKLLTRFSVKLSRLATKQSKIAVFSQTFLEFNNQ